jgi:hypothetical protein
VPLYGTTRLIERKLEEKNALDPLPSTEDIIRDREELAEQIRALHELQRMAASYGHDISVPASNAREAVQWLYFGYLAGVKEQNGAAMSLGRTTTFLDIYFERDLTSGTLTEQERRKSSTTSSSNCASSVSSARPSTTSCSPAIRPGSPSPSRHGRRRPVACDEDQLPHPADALQPGPRSRTESDDLVLAQAARGLPAICGQGRHRHELAAVRERRDHAPDLG